MKLSTNPSRSTWRKIADSRLINALAAPNGMGRYLEALNPMWSLDPNRIPAYITAIHRETSDSVTLELSPNGDWQGFRPGQFCQLYIEINGRLHSRSYSLNCRAGRLAITVKAQADGLVSKHINSKLNVGDIIRLSPPMGDFVLPVQLPDAMLMVAAGSGITPIMAMVEAALKKGYQGGITLLYYNHSEADTIFIKRLQELASANPHFSLLPVFSDGSSELSGHFNQHHLLKTLSFQNTLSAHTAAVSLPECFVCGPESLIQAVSEEYKQFGHAEKFHAERFKPVINVSGNTEVVGKLAFKSSQSEVSSDNRNLLEQAEAAGLQPQAGCRMGICHSCSCLKTEGSVRNMNSGEISHGEEYIRLCISQPLGNVSLAI
ncbi:MAG: ferredoxin reductase [Zhongshania sp.]|uniref:ferredoxin reductase n=1 Tax=Zhongshania sp. TaxID=1971902 RepID=UPI002616360B|nr:ferredoxin reductase [Zhongshania sp.]MDF1693922.1 ferredoxin reductase [Zhongshania sp.]